MGAISGPPSPSRNTEERDGCAGAGRTFGGDFGAPSPSRNTEERPGCAGAGRTFGGMGRFRPPQVHPATPRSTTAAPGRDEHLGAWGRFRGPPSPSRNTEGRDGCAGARRTFGGMGAISGPPKSIAQHRGARRLRRGATNIWGHGGDFGAPQVHRATPRSATAAPGRDEHLGAWGPFRGPHLFY